MRAAVVGAGAAGARLALAQAAADGAQVAGGLAVGQRVPPGGGRGGGHGRLLPDGLRMETV